MEKIGDMLEKFGKAKFGDRFIRGIVPDSWPFTMIEYVDENGTVQYEGHSFFNLEGEYIAWKAAAE